MECHECIAQQPHVGFIADVSPPSDCRPSSIQLLTCRGSKDVPTNVPLTRGHLVRYDWASTGDGECRLIRPVAQIFPEQHDIEVYRAEDRIVAVYRYEPPDEFRQFAQSGRPLAIRHPLFGKILLTNPQKLIGLPSFSVAVVAHSTEQLPDCGAVALAFRPPGARKFVEFDLRPLTDRDIPDLDVVSVAFLDAYRLRQRPDVKVRSLCERIGTTENARGSPPAPLGVMRSTEGEHSPGAAPNHADWTPQNFERQDGSNQPPPAARNQQALEEHGIFHTEPAIPEADLLPPHDWSDELSCGGDVEKDAWYEFGEASARPLRQADPQSEEARRRLARKFFSDKFENYPLDRAHLHRPAASCAVQDLPRCNFEKPRYHESQSEQRRLHASDRFCRAERQSGRPYKEKREDERATFRPDRRERRDYERLHGDVERAEVVAAVRSLSGRELYEAMSKEQLCGLWSMIMGIGGQQRRLSALQWPDCADEGAAVHERRRHSPPQEERQRSGGSRGRSDESLRTRPHDLEEQAGERRRTSRTTVRRESPPRPLKSRQTVRPVVDHHEGGEIKLDYGVAPVRRTPHRNSRPTEQTRRMAVDREARCHVSTQTCDLQRSFVGPVRGVSFLDAEEVQRLAPRTAGGGPTTSKAAH